MKKLESRLVTVDTKNLIDKVVGTPEVRFEDGLVLFRKHVEQGLVQEFLRERFNLDVVPVREASALNNLREWSLYLNGKMYYHEGIRVVCADYETCMEIGLQLMLKKIIDEKLKPTT